MVDLKATTNWSKAQVSEILWDILYTSLKKTPFGVLLSISINFNPGMDNLSYTSQNMRWNYLTISKLRRWNRLCLGRDKLFRSPLTKKYVYLCILELNLILVSRIGPRWPSHFAMVLSNVFWSGRWNLLVQIFVSLKCHFHFWIKKPLYMA